MTRTRCAIYTRKSSEEGLEQAFNSLDAQREACEAYIRSQRHEGWVLHPDPYDDGGLSGGTLDRPALQRLLEDIRAGRIDRVVVYKIDRLTRSLSDFARIVDVLDAAGASFVSVTQSFNTATSMGRLTLNMLLSFAQFEREVTAERIRDKIAASKRKGLWMGGTPPLGYAPDGRTLRILEPDAEVVRTIYRLYETTGTLRQARAELDRLGLRTARRTTRDGKLVGGHAFSHGHLYQVLTNPIYAGRIRHKGDVHPGQHAPIIDPDRWDALQARMQDASVRPHSRGTLRSRQPGTFRSPLVGKLFDETGDRLTPSHTKTARGKRLRYYVSRRLIVGTADPDIGGWRLPAHDLETALQGIARTHLDTAARRASLVADATAQDSLAIRTTLTAADEQTPNNLLPLIERIDIAPGTLDLQLDRTALATVLSVDPQRISDAALRLSAPFRQRKRGVETRIVIDGGSATPDATLIRNIARARRYLSMVQAGQTLKEIAAAEGVSNHRIQKLIDLAFLAPDIIRDVTQGTQPVGLTSEYLLRHRIPADWADQRALFSTL